MGGGAGGQRGKEGGGEYAYRESINCVNQQCITKDCSAVVGHLSLLLGTG